MTGAFVRLHQAVGDFADAHPRLWAALAAASCLVAMAVAGTVAP